MEINFGERDALGVVAIETRTRRVMGAAGVFTNGTKGGFA